MLNERFGLFFILLVCLAGNIFGAFDYGRKLYTVSTKHFDIIYADNSKDAALYIASFADEFFENINKLIQNNWKERITVVVSDDYDDIQGYANVTPNYSTITIFDTPASIETSVGNSKDFIKYEFFHELTHVISQNVRSDLLEFFSKVFGNWIYPEAAMPMFMVEGVTVGTENSDGIEDVSHTDGRINHPWVAEQIKQDIAEDRFKSPQQATGAYDVYPTRTIFYHYGGFFNHYILKKYGDEKYRELWHKVGENILSAIGGGWSLDGSFFDSYLPFMFFGQTFGIGTAFKSVYGVSVEEEWNNFKEDMRYKGVLETNKQALTESYANIDYPVIVKGDLYYVDHFNEAVVCYDIKNKSSVYLIEGEGIESISVSPDGKKLLVNRFVYKDRKNGLLKAITQFYDIEKRQFDGRTIEGFREVSFFNDGLIGIRAKSRFTDIVKINFKGEPEIVLAGKSTLYFSTPKQLNDKEIVFLLNDNDKMKIGKYNFETKKTQALEAPVQYVKNIGVYEDKILFVYNNDFTFYKLAVLDGNNLTLQTNNYSGGVFFPMTDNGRIYYAGSFSSGYKFMVYPESLTGISGSKSTVNFSDLTAGSDTNSRTTGFSGKVGDYNALPYLLPHNWIPFIGFQGEDLLDYNSVMNWATGNHQFLGFDSLGVYTRLQDPTAMNTIGVMAYYNIFFPFANAGIDWENSSLPVHFRVLANDKLKYSYYYGTYLRDTLGLLDLNYTFNFTSQNQYLKIGAVQSYEVQSYYNDNLNPYEWPVFSDIYSEKLYFKLADYTMFHPYRVYNYVRGFELNGYFTYNIPSWNNSYAYYETGGDIQIYPYYFPLILSVNGAYNSIGALSPYSRNYYEYSDIPLYSYYYIGSDTAVEVLNFDTQFGLPLFLPLYINQISITAGYRNAYIAENYLNSAYTRLTMTIPYMYGHLSQIKVNFFAEVYYALNISSFGYYIGFNLGKQLDQN